VLSLRRANRPLTTLSYRGGHLIATSVAMSQPNITPAPSVKCRSPFATALAAIVQFVSVAAGQGGAGTEQGRAAGAEPALGP
jgi:hypothetical protein